MSKCFHLLTTLLYHVAIGLVESSDTRLWSHHHPQLAEFADPGMLFQEGRYPVHHMVKHPTIDGKNNIGYDNSRQRDSFHIPDDPF